MKKSTEPSEVQGEGDIEADRHYRQATENFVKSGKVETALKKLKTQTLRDSKPPKEPEQGGLSGAEGKDKA